MLVQKKGFTKSTKKLLIILGSVIVIGGGYFIWNYFSTNASSDSQVNLTNTNTITAKKIQTNLDTEIFDDPQFQALDRDEFEGFVDQEQGIVLSEDIPTDLKGLTIKNPETGSSLIIFWQLPEFINFDRVVIYRSFILGQLGEQLISIDVARNDSLKIGSYTDLDLKNGINYYYFIEPRIGKETEGESGPSINSTILSNLQVSGSPSDIASPASPLNVQVMSTSEGEMKISWVNPDEADLSAINIYRSTEKGTLGNLIISISAGNFGDYKQEGNNLVYTDDTIKLNTVYYYTVTSVDDDGNESTTDVLTAPYKSIFYNPFAPIDF